jgi:hypothetical protein
MKMQHDGPISEAEELLEIGQRYSLSFKCECDGCKATRSGIEHKLREDILQLAQAFARADLGTQFRGLFEEWDAKQISEELSVPINL